MDTVPSTSILALNDDCLELICTFVGCSTTPSYYDDGGYNEILRQINLAQTCIRFRNIFINLIWKSKEKHLTLRPVALRNVLGPLNYISYMKAMQWKLSKLELSSSCLEWFLAEMLEADIVSFPSITACTVNQGIGPEDRRQFDRKFSLLVKSFLPNLRCLSSNGPISWKTLKSLEELNINGSSSMQASYFRNLTSKLKNLRMLKLCLQLSNEHTTENSAFVIELPKDLEVLHLHVSAMSATIAAIPLLKKLQRLVITCGLFEDFKDCAKTIQKLLLENLQNTTGVGFNVYMPQWFWYRPKIYFDIGNLISTLKNLQKLCLRSITGLNNEAVLKVVAESPKLQHLHISECPSIQFKKLLTELFELRMSQNQNLKLVKQPLYIYFTNQQAKTKYSAISQMEGYIEMGVKCPLEIETGISATNFVFDFV